MALSCGPCGSRSARRSCRGQAHRELDHSQVLSATGALYRAVVDADLEGIVAKRLADAYYPKLARRHKALNRPYSQRHGRAEWFHERRCRAAESEDVAAVSAA